MYEPHDHFPLPPDSSTIWRYLSFIQFAALISSRKMHFTRLTQFQDPFECTFPPTLLELSREAVRQMLVEKKIDDTDLVEYLPKAATRMADYMQKTCYANCWHQNDNESAAMWAQYAKDGVAIRSTVGRLKSCFHETKKPIILLNVQYTYGDPSAIRAPNAFSSVWCAPQKVVHML